MGKKLEMIPKKIQGYIDLPWMKIVADALEHNDRLLLVGHCGVGKTSAVEQIASRENWEVRRVNLNGQTTISSLVGQWTAKDGETVWIDGIVAQALRQGQILILDEIDFALPEVLAVLHPVLEGDNPCLVLDEKDGEIVRPKKGFRVSATANSIGADTDDRALYQGTGVMNEAFMDRWSTVIRVGWPPAELEAKILMKRVPGLPASVAALIVRVAGECREAFGKGEIFTTFSPRKCLQWADKCLRYGNMTDSAKVTILNKIGDEDRQVIGGVIQRWTGEDLGLKK